MQTGNKYGSIPDLPDEELDDPEELERQVFIKEWGPILDRERCCPLQNCELLTKCEILGDDVRSYLKATAFHTLQTP